MKKLVLVLTLVGIGSASQAQMAVENALDGIYGNPHKLAVANMRAVQKAKNAQRQKIKAQRQKLIDIKIATEKNRKRALLEASHARVAQADNALEIATEIIESVQILDVDVYDGKVKERVVNVGDGSTQNVYSYKVDILVRLVEATGEEAIGSFSKVITLVVPYPEIAAQKAEDTLASKVMEAVEEGRFLTADEVFSHVDVEELEDGNDVPYWSRRVVE